MKKNSLLLFLLVSVQCYNACFAQQLAQYSLYMYNNYLLNPAVGGSKACSDIKLGYRTQWMGFDGNPKTAYASFHTRLKFKTKPYLKARHGVGAYVDNDQVGLSSKSTFMVGYAYHVQVTHKTYFSAGIFAGFQQYSINLQGANLIPDPSDAAIHQGSQYIIPDINPGVFYYSDAFYAGVSVKNLVANKIKVVGTDTRLVRHIYISGGKRFALSKTMFLLPSFNVKYAVKAPLALDLTALFDFNNKLDLGLGYRGITGGDALSAIIHLNLGRALSLGYAYDFPLSKIRNVTYQTHEVILGFKICPETERGDTRNLCPAYD